MKRILIFLMLLASCQKKDSNPKQQSDEPAPIDNLVRKNNVVRVWYKTRSPGYDSYFSVKTSEINGAPFFLQEDHKSKNEETFSIVTDRKYVFVSYSAYGKPIAGQSQKCKMDITIWINDTILKKDTAIFGSSQNIYMYK